MKFLYKYGKYIFRFKINKSKIVYLRFSEINILQRHNFYLDISVGWIVLNFLLFSLNLCVVVNLIKNLIENNEYDKIAIKSFNHYRVITIFVIPYLFI